MSADHNQVEANVPGAAPPVVELTPKAEQACPVDSTPARMLYQDTRFYIRTSGAFLYIILYYLILSYIIPYTVLQNLAIFLGSLCIFLGQPFIIWQKP